MAPHERSSLSVDRRDAGIVGPDAHRSVVWVRGEHDCATTAELSEQLARAIAGADADLVVDLSEVQFMDASTVTVIVRARQFLRLRSRSLTLRSPSKCALRVLDVCGLSDLIEPLPHGSIRDPSGSLGTWVAVPVIDRLARPAGRSPSGSPDRAGPEVSSSETEAPAVVGSTIRAGREAP